MFTLDAVINEKQETYNYSVTDDKGTKDYTTDREGHIIGILEWELHCWKYRSGGNGIMLYTEKVQETVEFADLSNKVQSVLDYLCTKTSELEDEREFAIRKKEHMYYQAINNNIKKKFIVSSTLQAIRRDIENMHDDIQANIKQEKSASEKCLETESDNA
ncbi:hypothetical protein [Staphylococcus equorum]|uniref:hypothetical protein n=1 Tax=Staphylococcus equorum TaxID=246432 RepID=UPI002981A749|nr:hypothetical protein [Staphylococcus equorum]MDW5472300.1 hypothetical protein [Staphylococcus equorum]